MTTERISIKITADGAKAARKDIEGLGAGAKSAASALGGLGSALKAVAAGAVVRETIRIADAYTDLTNKVRFATRSEQEMIAVRSELFRSANQNRQSIEAVTDTYSKLRLSTEALGLSQREVTELTDTLSKATVLSGASADNAANSLRQLGQGMASGALRGDELNSVLENTPYIAQVIAESLGKDIGAIRQMGAEGKITGEIIVDAFQGAREEIVEKFGQRVPKVSEALAVMGNTVTKLVGEVDSATGASASLAKTIIDISTALDEAIPDIKLLIQTAAGLDGMHRHEGLFQRIFGIGEEENGVSFTRKLAMGLAMVQDQIYFTSRAWDKLMHVATTPIESLTNPGRLRDLWQALGTDVTTAVGPNTQRLFDSFAAADTARLGAGFGRAAGTAPPTDPLDVRGERRARSAAATKGATVQSELAQLQRRNELLQMSNERRRIEGELDQIRSQIKRKLLPQEEQEIRALLERNRVQEFVNQSLEEGKRLQEELLEKERERIAEHHEKRGAIASKRAAEIAMIGAEERQRAQDSTFEGAKAVMGEDYLANVRTLGQEMALIFGPGGTIQQGLHGVVGSLSDAIGYSIAFGRSWGDTAEAIENIGRSIVGEIISSLIRIPIQMGINEAVASGLRAKATAETVASNAAIATSAAPAAAATSLATAGGNSVGATAAILGVAALAAGALAVTAFEQGGYTGNGPRSGVAGLVHGKEFVLHADATSKYRREAEAMNAGTYRPGGGGSVSVTIVDQTDGGTTFETRQLSESEIEVIVRRVAPDAVAKDLRAPQSKVGRAISQTTTARRVRA